MDRPITTPIDAPDGWTALRQQGRREQKTYTCPRCSRSVSSTSQHVIAWPTETDGDERRHWHSACWESAKKEGLDRYRWG